MKHMILVKFNDKVTDKNELLPEIRELFSPLTLIPGIYSVACRPNCVDRPNRWDLLIEIEMDRAAFDLYDKSEEHKSWKREYGDYLESKAIFDTED